MNARTVRSSIVIVAGFIALTAIGGGLAMLTGVDEFPLAWLKGTPFKDYTIPALILAIVVGGSSLAATIMVFTRIRSEALASITAGLMMAGYVVVEVLILEQVPSGPTLVETVYFVLGMVVCFLGISLSRLEHQDLSVEPVGNFTQR